MKARYVSLNINGIEIKGMEKPRSKRVHFCSMEFLESINRQPKTAQDRKLIEQMLEMEFTLMIDQDGYIKTFIAKLLGNIKTGFSCKPIGKNPYIIYFYPRRPCRNQYFHFLLTSFAR